MKAFVEKVGFWLLSPVLPASSPMAFPLKNFAYSSPLLEFIDPVLVFPSSSLWARSFLRAFMLLDPRLNFTAHTPTSLQKPTLIKL